MKKLLLLLILTLGISQTKLETDSNMSNDKDQNIESNINLAGNKLLKNVQS